MKSRKSVKTNKEHIIDGIDVNNIWKYPTKKILAAEAKSHAPEIQYKIGMFIYNVFQEEFDELNKNLEREYGENFEIVSKIYATAETARSIEWYKKAAK